MALANLTDKAMTLASQIRTYWKKPMNGKYMTFREIAAYSGGGIGAYMIITIGTACLLSANNTLLSSVLGVDPMDMYVMYVIAVLANIPLTGIRATIIDNTRNKAGKYRPYIVTMALPAAIICCVMVWFPYGTLNAVFGADTGYIIKCAIILVLNLLLHFVYYFFYDAYENLIHVLSPNTQERTNVASVKSIVYSLAPTLVNLFTPIIAEHIFHTNATDIRVYRLLYPILAVLGILLCIVVYKYTEEKIVQARTHVAKIRFWDALKAVAKNKYFWIISLAGWVGFLENAYANILYWLYNYGGACSGDAYGIVVTVYGNASLWGMILAPFCVKRWGKKMVLVVTNIFNILFILLMLPFLREINGLTIWLVMGCLWLNALMGSFMHILNPAIQADIRDYQHYISGERIDGMFATVTSIGTIITLATSSVLPAIYERSGLTKENAKIITENPKILDRMLGGGQTVGEVLADQLGKGQNNYENAYSALYDLDILMPLLQMLVIIAAVGAALNVIPYIWYDFNEKKQQSVIKVLKVRSMFEDYGNGVLNDGDLVEAVDIINNSRRMAFEHPKDTDKNSYKAISDKAERKLAKNAYKADLAYNEEIEIAKFVCDELDKFSKPEFMFRIHESRKIFNAGLNGIYYLDPISVRNEINAAKGLPKTTDDEKAIRKAAIEIAKSKLDACLTVRKYYVATEKKFVQPDYRMLEKKYEHQDSIERRIKQLNDMLKNTKNKSKTGETKKKIEKLRTELKNAAYETKLLQNEIANFERAAKPYTNAKKLLMQSENYQRLGEISSLYDVAALRHEKAEAKRIAKEAREAAAEKAARDRIKAEKAMKKAAKEAEKAAKKNK